MSSRTALSARSTLAVVAAAVLAAGSAATAAPAKAQPKPQAAATVAPPQTDAVKSAMKHAWDKNKQVTEGKNADYIPALAKVDPRLFAIAVVTVDGRVIAMGDDEHLFSIQSTSKPFVAARLMSEMGTEKVEEKLGVNASGLPFNSIEAIEQNKAAEDPPTANPLVNAGAIAAVGNLEADSAKARWSKVASTLNAFAGRPLSVDQEIYKSEAETNTRNRAIADLLKAYEVIPGDPGEALDVYTRQCSVAVNVRDLAAMGATLASGGVNPLTKQRVVPPDIAAATLAVMMTAGMYEDSGTWAFEVGAPAKSGVGGGLVAVVPGRYAVAAFAPPLDEAGNSVRAQGAIKGIIEELGGNVFDPPALARGR